ncbi:hypothetical protein Nepgr_018709 [Nepenthes gracilis]|uniref:Uncharacterized protein n=1 Tax=Nepenthes gracilis TaxID=150966 RepID=A0AAD3SSP4_NEPGR|nr:hypothetical protein Nepgr_018709 [Nepenthes gracilis]
MSAAKKALRHLQLQRLLFTARSEPFCNKQVPNPAPNINKTQLVHHLLSSNNSKSTLSAHGYPSFYHRAKDQKQYPPATAGGIHVQPSEAPNTRQQLILRDCSNSMCVTANKALQQLQHQ